MKKTKYTIIWNRYLGYGNAYVVCIKRINCKNKTLNNWIVKLNPEYIFKGWPKRV